MKRGIVAGLVLALGAVAPGAAEASSVLKVKDGKARRAHDPLLPPRSQTALPVVPRRAALSRRAQRAPLARTAALTPVERATYTSALTDAKRARDGLSGARRSELSAVIATAEALDARGELNASRLNAIVMTLRRNTEFWKANQPPAAGTRVEFAGSPVILEYYVGRGLQIQPLANFGKANAAWSTCKGKADRTCTILRTHLDAMIALAAKRGTFTTWEYYFDFEGGVPPWTSGMSQGTGVQALSRAYNLTGVAKYRDVATAALAAFETAPPVGVAQPATSGTHYLMYSYAPSLFIFNGFLQALVGLDDYRDYTGDARGTTLFRAGHSHARWLVPQSDTGVWSRYSLGGPQSTREYHVLLRDILANLCKRIGTPEYCTTADRFTQYLAAPAAPR
jgi:D-glucuronyl C5-epimerase-like protein